LLAQWEDTTNPTLTSDSRAHGLVHGIAQRHAALRSGAQSFLVGLVGRGIKHSRSPLIHQREGKRLGLFYTYALLDFDDCGLPDSALSEVVAAAESAGYSGLNVTHPFKQCIVELVSDLSPEAVSIGAVNSIVFAGARRIGYNTDGWGFAQSFRRHMAGCPLDIALLLGAGGGGAAVAHALLELGVKELQIFDPDGRRAANLASRMVERFGRAVVPVTNPSGAVKQVTGVINATPIGMDKYPGTPISPGLLTSRHWVADIVYFPAETQLIRSARQLGCRTLSGAGMAVYQAVKAFELFTGIAPDPGEMTRHFEARP
jgi:shikimate dehydrogenase